MIKTSSPGKVILFGEHSVVYDKTGIAAAVDIRSSIKCNVRSGGIEIDLIDLNENVLTHHGELFALLDKVDFFIEKKDFDGLRFLAKEDVASPIKAVLAKTIRDLDYRGGVKLSIHSDIPIASGLGSCPAITTAVVAALQALVKGVINRDKIAEISYLGEIISHAGTPSGIDNNTVTYGGYIQFKKSEGVKPLEIDATLPIVIGSTGIKSPTGEMVARVREAREREPDRINGILDQMDEIAKSGIEAIQKNDLNEIARCINRNHDLLRLLDVSHPMLEKLVAAAKTNGALAAKLSGAGGGGIMYALCKDKAGQIQVAHAIEKAGGSSIITTIGAEGVRIDEIGKRFKG